MNATLDFTTVSLTRSGLPVGLRDRIETKLRAVNKRLAKIGAPPATVEYGEVKTVKETTESGWEVTYDVYDEITVTGVEAKFAGWTPVATLDHTIAETEALVAKFPAAIANETEIPEAYRFTGPACDHCGLDRARNSTVLFVSETGEWLQVGTTCIVEFLGVDPANVLNLMGISGILDDEDTDEWRAAQSKREPSTESFVIIADALTRAFGFVKAQPDDWRDEPTKNLAHDIAMGFNSKRIREITAELTYRDEAYDEVVAWVAEQGDTDFIRSARLALECVDVKPRTAGILACLPFVAERSKSEAAEKEAVEAAIPNGDGSAHFGQVGDKIVVEGVVTTAFTMEGFYGPKVRLTVVGDDGNLVTTVGSGEALFKYDRGDRVEFRGTISGHGEWNDRKQTECKRVKLLDPKTPVDTVKLVKVGQQATTFVSQGYTTSDGEIHREYVTGTVTKVAKQLDRYVYTIDGAHGIRFGHEITVPEA